MEKGGGEGRRRRRMKVKGGVRALEMDPIDMVSANPS